MQQQQVENHTHIGVGTLPSTPLVILLPVSLKNRTSDEHVQAPQSSSAADRSDLTATDAIRREV